MHFSCTGVGRLKLMAMHARWIQAASPSCVQLLEDRKAALAPRATSSTSVDGEAAAASVASVLNAGVAAALAMSSATAAVAGRGRFLPALVEDEDEAKRETIGLECISGLTSRLVGGGWGRGDGRTGCACVKGERRKKSEA